MKHDLSTTDLVRQLGRVGLRPSDEMVASIVGRGDEAIAPLLNLALETTTLDEAEPASLGPLHALRLLGELKPTDAARQILERLPLPMNERPTQGAFLWSQEAPQIVAAFGADVLPIVLQIADDPETPPLRRGAAYATLGYLAVTAPDHRDAIVAALHAHLAGETDSSALGYLVAALAQLGARPAYSEIMAAYREKRVDRSIMSAADARQMLLGSTSQRQLDCARHTLAERYEQHGPYSEEQQRAMAEMVRQQGGR